MFLSFIHGKCDSWLLHYSFRADGCSSTHSTQVMDLAPSLTCCRPCSRGKIQDALLCHLFPAQGAWQNQEELEKPRAISPLPWGSLWNRKVLFALLGLGFLQWRASLWLQTLDNTGRYKIQDNFLSLFNFSFLANSRLLIRANLLLV